MQNRVGFLKQRRLTRPDISKLIARVQQNIHQHLNGVRKQLIRLQQGFKQHRDTKRSAKKTSHKHKTGKSAPKRYSKCRQSRRSG